MLVRQGIYFCVDMGLGCGVFEFWQHLSLIEVHMTSVHCGLFALPFDFNEIGPPRTLFRETQEYPVMSTAMFGVLVHTISTGAIFLTCFC